MRMKSIAACCRVLADRPYGDIQNAANRLMQDEETRLDTHRKSMAARFAGRLVVIGRTCMSPMTSWVHSRRSRSRFWASKTSRSACGG